MPSAYIDLKNCQFFVRGGLGTTDSTGLVNLMAGYSIGATTMLVDAITGAIPTGSTFTLDGHATIYTVTSHIETSTNTTSITFTPGLVVAAVDNDPIAFYGPAVEANIGDGNLTYDEKRPLEYKKNRGKLDVVRLADEEPMDVNFAFAWTYLSSASTDVIPTLEEALKQEGLAAAWPSTGIDCEPYAVDLIIVNTPVGCGAADEKVEMITLPDFRWTSLAHDPKAGTITCQGTCNATKAIKDRLDA